MDSTHRFQKTARFLKRSLRIGLKYAGDLYHGYPFTYASLQGASTADEYSFLWHRSTTPIPDRGSDEVRTNRIFNLQLATEQIHQLQIDPGQIFSFCNRVGDPSLRNGYRAGAVFVGGQVTTGAGGGLCLIATNLFHLFLNAGCEILERHAHSIDAYGRDRFYELGQDASIAYGYKDLIVRNQTDVPLILKLQVSPESGEVISSLWGQLPRPYQVDVVSVVQRELVSPLPNGISGWEIETRRAVRAPQPISAEAIVSSSLVKEGGWQIDYCTQSIYEPCEDSRPRATVTASYG